MHLPPGYKLEQPEWGWGSVEEEEELWKVIGLSLLLVFIVTAALFESLEQPFLIMTTIPMALIGVFIMFWLVDQPFDRSAYIGVVLLGGIVVNNAIIMLDHINQLRRKGLEKLEAIITGASDRLRPILMTSLTTIVGLLPMVIAADKTGLWYALALATIGGMMASMLFVLLVLPALCAIEASRRNQAGDSKRILHSFLLTFFNLQFAALHNSSISSRNVSRTPHLRARPGLSISGLPFVARGIFNSVCEKDSTLPST